MSAPGMRQYDTIPEQALKLGRVGAWAPGRYMCKCIACERQFEGDKRAMNCLPCAVSRLSLIASRLTVDGLAGVICEHTGGFLSPVSREAIAQAIISHITGPDELERLSRPTGKSLGIPGPEANADAGTSKNAPTEQVTK